MSGHSLRGVVVRQGEHTDSCSQQGGERRKENDELQGMLAVGLQELDRLQLRGLTMLVLMLTPIMCVLWCLKSVALNRYERHTTRAELDGALRLDVAGARSKKRSGVSAEPGNKL